MRTLLACQITILKDVWQGRASYLPWPSILSPPFVTLAVQLIITSLATHFCITSLPTLLYIKSLAALPRITLPATTTVHHIDQIILSRRKEYQASWQPVLHKSMSTLLRNTMSLVAEVRSFFLFL